MFSDKQSALTPCQTGEFSYFQIDSFQIVSAMLTKYSILSGHCCFLARHLDTSRIHIHWLEMRSRIENRKNGHFELTIIMTKLSFSARSFQSQTNGDFTGLFHSTFDNLSFRIRIHYRWYCWYCEWISFHSNKWLLLCGNLLFVQYVQGRMWERSELLELFEKQFSNKLRDWTALCLRFWE